MGVCKLWRALKRWFGCSRKVVKPYYRYPESTIPSYNPDAYSESQLGFLSVTTAVYN